MNYCIIVFAFIIIDIVTGLIYAFASGSFKSSLMREGGLHKMGEICLELFSYFLQYALSKIGQADLPIIEIVSFYIIIMEIGSILENITKMNPQLKEIAQKINDLVRGIKNETKV